VFFTFKQLQKVQAMFSRDQKVLLGMSGIDNLDQTINKTLMTSKRAKVTVKALKEFDKMTGSFQNKDVSEDFSVNKTLLFLQNNGKFQSMSPRGP
jgi:hypothetical protein